MNTKLGDTVHVDLNLNISNRINDLRAWQKQWEQENAVLTSRIMALSDTYFDQQLSLQISNFRKKREFLIVQHPLEISPDTIKEIGYRNINDYLISQYVTLTQEEKLLWLRNLKFIITADLRGLEKKISEIREFRAFGQQRNFLLQGPSGSGKTTIINWLGFCNPPIVEKERNNIPILGIDAPTDNKSKLPLLRCFIEGCGRSYTRGNTEDELQKKACHCINKCGVEIVFIDEIEHLKRHEIRRKLLEISNLTHGVTYICAACNPTSFLEGDVEIAGRWNDIYKLEPYADDRLQGLLLYLDLLLPFSRSSNLADWTLPQGRNKEATIGPAKLIANLTGGILRDIMILLYDSSKTALKREMPALTVELMQETWGNIQSGAPGIK